MSKRATMITALLIVLVSALIIELVIVPPIYRQRWLKDRSIRQASYFQLQVSCKIARSLYEHTGILISDFSHLSKTAFYPLKGTAAPCGGTFTLQVMLDEGKICWQGRWKSSERWVEVGQRSQDRIQAQAIIDDLHTHRLLSTYLKGSRWWSTLVEHLWTEHEQEISNIIALQKKYCRFSLHRKELLKPLLFDIPRTETQLQAYQQWLSHLQGRDMLLDSWERPIRFLFLNGNLVAWSAGKDGQWNTSDDVRVASKTVSK